MKQIIRDSSAYYLVGYSSTQAPTDGKFHEIKVRVKRPGVQVRARRGYWAYTGGRCRSARPASDQAAGPPPAVTKALAAIAPMTNRRYIRTWIGHRHGRRRQDQGDVPVGAAAADARHQARRAAARHAAGHHRRRARSSIAAACRRSWRLSGSGASVSFDAKPGKLDVRLTIEGDGTGTLDSEDRDLTVPDLSAPEIMLIGTPRVWFARNAREFTALTSASRPRRPRRVISAAPIACWFASTPSRPAGSRRS